jgi:hypothetical protein
MALDANATSQSSGATAIHSAYVLNVTQTAQSAQGIATQRAYILTATPLAALQDSIVRTQNKANRTALWDEFVIVPLKVILSTLVILLLIYGGVLAYRRLMPVLELRLRTISRGNGRKPLILLDGMSRDPDPVRLSSFPRLPGQIHPARLPGDQTTVQVEIIRPSEPVVAGWIAEAEQKLRGSGDDTQ